MKNVRNQPFLTVSEIISEIGKEREPFAILFRDLRGIVRSVDMITPDRFASRIVRLGEIAFRQADILSVCFADGQTVRVANVGRDIHGYYSFAN